MADSTDRKVDLEGELQSVFEERPYLRELFYPEVILSEFELLDSSPVPSRELELEDGLLTIALVSTISEEHFVRRYPGALTEQEVALRLFKENPLDFQLGSVTVDSLEVLKLSGI